MTVPLCKESELCVFAGNLPVLSDTSGQDELSQSVRLKKLDRLRAGGKTEGGEDRKPGVSRGRRKR
jgi:hypothetical protein